MGAPCPSLPAESGKSVYRNLSEELSLPPNLRLTDKQRASFPLPRCRDEEQPMILATFPEDSSTKPEYLKVYLGEIPTFVKPAPGEY